MKRKNLKVDLCVIGAGAAGLSVAGGAAMLGLDVVLYEAGEMGGECLNTGCVPSKALLAAGKQAQHVRTAGAVGVRVSAPEIDFAAVMQYVHGAISDIAPHDSQERFEKIGATVIRERAEFVSQDCVESKSARVTAKRFVLATGSDPFIPPIPGIETVPYRTNETLFDLTELPRHLLILGAGPAGLEMAQAFHRLGAQVTVIEAGSALSNADPDHAQTLLSRLRDEGVTILERTEAQSITATEDGLRMECAGDHPQALEGSHLFVAAGRRVRTEGLGLEAAGVATGKHGIVIDEKLRTSNKRIFAAGDAAGLDMLTHAAGWQASVLIRNFYFAQRTKADSGLIPRALYTEPELAWVGMSETEARAKHGDRVRVMDTPFDDNDRAIAEGETPGGVKLIIGKGGKILGASILGEGAADLLQIVQGVIAAGGKVRALTGYIPAYPTRGEAMRGAASAYYKDAVFGPWARRLARFLTYFQ